MEIAIDFDGTVVTHDYPRVGKDIGAVLVLKELVDNGHQLILFTMRSGDTLVDAIRWFASNDIPLYGVQFNPTQAEWTSSNKCYAQLYIDDAALGIPLLQDIKRKTGEIIPINNDYYCSWKLYNDLLLEGTEVIGRPYVNWVKVRTMLHAKGLIK